MAVKVYSSTVISFLGAITTQLRSHWKLFSEIPSQRNEPERKQRKDLGIPRAPGRHSKSAWLSSQCVQWLGAAGPVGVHGGRSGPLWDGIQRCWKLSEPGPNGRCLGHRCLRGEGENRGQESKPGHPTSFLSHQVISFFLYTWSCPDALQHLSYSPGAFAGGYSDGAA